MSTHATDDATRFQTEPQPNAHACGATGCTRDDDLDLVTDGQGWTRTLCPTHRRQVLGGDAVR